MKIHQRHLAVDQPDTPPALVASKRLSRVQIFSALSVFALLIALRLPGAWIEGRFQDEEATVFLAFAWNFPWVEALFRSFAGYWNLAANGLTLLVASAVQGGLLSLEHAPYATMILSLLSQLMPAWLILTGEARWLNGVRPRLVMLLVMALAPTSEEVLLNVMHVQFHLALSVALIVALDVPRGRTARGISVILLLLAPLCGPGAIMFLPLLLLRALIEREHGRLVQLVALGLGAAVQMSVFYGASPVRETGLPPVNLLDETMLRIIAGTSLRLLVLPFAGIPVALHLGFVAPEQPLLALALGLLPPIGFGLLGWSAWKRRDGSAWLLAGSILVMVVTLGVGLATMNPRAAYFAYAGPRYNYVPLVLLGLVLVAGCWARNQSRGGAIHVGLLALFLLYGASSYLRSPQVYAEGPSWRREVAAWRQARTHPLRVWPGQYSADLSGRAQQCRPPVVRGDPTAPRYCESGWLSTFNGAPPERR